MEDLIKELVKQLESAHATLELYADNSRYFKTENAATGLTFAQDEGGELARNEINEIEELLELVACEVAHG